MHEQPYQSHSTDIAERVNCIKCKHFYVTWDPRFPRGCRAYGFKTSRYPAAVVQASSGMPCMQFARKHQDG